MKIVVLIIVLCGTVSGDVADIINPSREYLPPSREYLPPLLPEYMQVPPETSTYVQDPPENSASSASVNTFVEEGTYIPVKVVIESSSHSTSSLRQYLPPLAVSATEKIIEYDRTTPQIISHEDENDPSASNSIQSREFIEITTTDIRIDADREDTTPNNIPTEGTTPKESYDEEITTLDTADTVSTESIVATTAFSPVDKTTTEDDSIIIQTLSNTETTTTTIKDDIQEISTTESIPTTTEIATSSSVDTVTTESDTDSILTISTTESIATTTESVYTESSTDAIQKVYLTESSPITTAFTPVDIHTTESDPLNTQIFSTTIPEYIQNAQALQVATEKSTSETNALATTNEATSELTIPQSEPSTPETLLLEDGYHYSIPSNFLWFS